MRNRKMKSKKFRINAKGITLIALVITIVVLLILAGVSIATLTGDNGILTRANDAKNKTEQAQRDEATLLSQLENIIYTNTGENYKAPFIPEGYQHIGSEEWNEGYTIVDNYGNEYIWIPVESLSDVYNEYKEKERSWDDILENSYATNNPEHYERVIQSISENGGFYIGKYEAGIDVARTSINEPIDMEIIPKSQQGLYPYNFINRDEAQELATQVLEGHSSLMYGIQFQAIIHFVNKYGNVDSLNATNYGNFNNSIFENEDIDGKNASYSKDNGITWIKVTTEGKLNGENWLGTTGFCSRNQVLNIFDIAGNIWEWILEGTLSEEQPGVYMSNAYYRQGTDKGFTKVDYRPLTRKDNSVGFRVAIIK